MWVADTGNHRIQRFTETGQFREVVSGAGTTLGPLLDPHRLHTLGDSTLIVFDQGSGEARLFSPAGHDEGSMGLTFGSMPSLVMHPRTAEALVLDTVDWKVKFVSGGGLVSRAVETPHSGMNGAFLEETATGSRLCLVPNAGGAILAGELNEDPVGSDPVSAAMAISQAFALQDLGQIVALTHEAVIHEYEPLLTLPGWLSAASNEAIATSSFLLASRNSLTAVVTASTSGAASPQEFRLRRSDVSSEWKCTRTPWGP